MDKGEKMTEEEWTMEETERAIYEWYLWDKVAPIIWSKKARDALGFFKYAFGKRNNIILNISFQQRLDNGIGLRSQSIAMGKGWTD